MKLRVEKNIDKGEVLWAVTIDGENHRHFRTVCGQTGDFGDPAHHTDLAAILPIRYGRWVMKHDDAPGFPVLSDDDTASERAEKLVRRIVLIRAWVESCKAADVAASGWVEVEIPPLVTQKRDARGRFTK